MKFQNKDNNGVEILIAEDSPTQAEGLEHLLEGYGYKTIATANGKEALEQIRKSRPTLVISDIIMPEMDGFALCKEIKSNEELKEIPVLLLTSLSSPQDVIKGLECGANSFIRKPYDEKYLLSRIEYTLTNKELRKKEKMQIGVELYLAGQKHFITAERQQILDLLISTYDQAVQINGDLKSKNEELEQLKQNLEKQVEARTAALKKEMEEHKQTEEALRQSEEQIRQIQKFEALGRLAGGVAHDFNNILTAIIGYAEIMHQRNLSQCKSQKEIEEIIKAAERASLLTRQLLAFSRKQVLTVENLDLNAIVKNIENMLHRIIGEDIELITRLGVEGGIIQADSTQVEQILMNLVVNSRDAMPRGGKITIETSLIELEKIKDTRLENALPGWYVVLSVSDTGIGMTPDVLSHIFEPFFTTKEKEKGTGLGLSTVYGIVKQSGGYITVYSEPNRGTTFKIYFPKAKGQIAVEPKKTQKSPKREIRGTETILVVEDEEVLRELAEEILKMNGYRVFSARDGEQAIQCCKENITKIDLMLSDLMLPRMSGEELVKRLSLMQPKMKVLYMSGFTEFAAEHQGLFKPGMAFIPKPFTPTALMQKVRQLLDASAEKK